MNKKLLISLVMIFQLVLFFYIYYIQSDLGVPMLSLVTFLINLEFLDLINPFVYTSSKLLFVVFILICPTFYLFIYWIASRINKAFQKSRPVLFYWVFWGNAIILLMHTSFTRTYLGFIIFFIYAGLIILLFKSYRKTQNKIFDISYIKLYLHYLIFSFMFLLSYYGIEMLLYLER